MELLKKFEIGAKTRTYQRIDGDYKINIFLGYNEEGQMSMVITEDGIEAKIKSSKIINVYIKKREDGKLALSFDLLEKDYKSLFIVFCRDMIISCEEVGSEMAISTAVDVRINYGQVK